MTPKETTLKTFFDTLLAEAKRPLTERNYKTLARQRYYVAPFSDNEIDSYLKGWVDEIPCDKLDSEYEYFLKLYNNHLSQWYKANTGSEIPRAGYMEDLKRFAVYDTQDHQALERIKLYVYGLVEQRKTGFTHNQTPQLPKELDNDKAKEIFTKAVEVGLMEVQGNGYKWHKSKVLLAYMLNKIYTEVFPATELDKLFGVSGLKQAVYSLPNNKKPPKGYEDIERLFKEA